MERPQELERPVVPGAALQPQPRNKALNEPVFYDEFLRGPGRKTVIFFPNWELLTVEVTVLGFPLKVYISST